MIPEIIAQSNSKGHWHPDTQLQLKDILSEMTQKAVRMVLLLTRERGLWTISCCLFFGFESFCSREKRWRIIYKTGCWSLLTQTLCYWQLRKDVQPALNHLAAILSICSLSNVYLKHLSTAGSMTSIGCPFTTRKVVEELALRLRSQSVAKSSLNITTSVPQRRPGLAAGSPCLLFFSWDSEAHSVLF